MKNFATFSLPPHNTLPMGAVAPAGKDRKLSFGERMQALLLTGILYFIMMVLYRDIVAPVYFFGGFVYAPAATPLVPYVLLLLTGLSINPRPRTMTDVFVLLSAIFLLIPATVLATQQSSDIEDLLVMHAAVLGTKVLSQRLGKLRYFHGENRINFSDLNIKMQPIFIFTGAVLFGLAVHVEGAFNLSFLNVYDYRLDFNESIGFPLNYLLPMAAGACIGFVMAVAIEQSRWVYVAFVLLMGLMFFGYSSHKAFLFYPLFAACGYYTIKWKYGGRILILGVFILGLFTIYSSGTFNSIMSSSFANRLLFIPAQIHYYFFDEFNEIGFQYWAESKFGLGFIQSKLPVPAVFYIGERMTGLTDVGANTGWIANGYMNAGVAGVAFYTGLLAIILATIDRLGALYGNAFVGAAFLIPIYSIINSIDLLAGLLTGGLMATFVIFFALVRPAQTDVRQG